MSAPANWEAVEDALQAIVVRLTGLPGERVIWETQGGPRPEGAFVSLRLDGTDSPGWEGERRQRDAEDPQPGADLVLEVAKQAESTLTLVAYSGRDVIGDASASVMLRRVRNGLDLASVTEELDEAGVSIFAVGTVQTIPSFLNTGFEGRATLDARLRVTDGAEELDTWIESAVIDPPILKE